MPEAYILLEIDNVAYAVPSEQVVRVEMVEKVTRVPNAPEFVEGVVSIRGQVIPVISLRKRFRLPPIEKNMRARLIIVRVEGRGGERQVGMIADSAREFIAIDAEQIRPVPEGLSGPGVTYLDGVAALPRGLVLVINLPRLLDADERDTLAEENGLFAAGSNEAA